MNRSFSCLLIGAFVLCFYLPNTCTAQWKWVKQTKIISRISPSDTSQLFTNNKLAIDGNGYIYATANFPFNCGIQFGSISVVKDPDSFIIATKYDSLGNSIWVKRASCTNLVFPASITTDKYNNIWVAGGWVGSYYDTLRLGAYKFISQASGINYNFLAKYDSNGNVLWATSWSPYLNGGGNEIKIKADTSGNIYYVGNFMKDTVSIGSFTLYNSLPHSGYSDILIAKLDNSGNVLWAKKVDGSLDDFIRTLTVDNAGNAYIAGSFKSATLTFGSTSILSPNNWYLTKYDPYGNIGWVKGFKDLRINGLATSKGDLYLAGGVDSNNTLIGSDTIIKHSINNTDFFIAKYNTVTGNYNWEKNYGSNGEARGVFIDAIGQPWAYGIYLKDSFIISSDTLRYTEMKAHGYDFPMFMVQFDSSGNIGCVANSLIGGASVEDNGMIADKKGYLYFASAIRYFVGKTGVLGPDTLTQTSFMDMLFAKYQPCNMPVLGNINLFQTEPELTIYPNPAYDEFTIKSNDVKNAVIELYNISGQLLKTYTTTGKTTTVSTSDLASGLYICKFTTEGNVSVVKKIMVVK